ncbi:MAG TPA: surface lipoprotein assembly modifier [Allosphingosinicella sp.]|nr:surface lipoprotein assembly modifier [Allosphingosinicella sp.]
MVLKPKAAHRRRSLNILLFLGGAVFAAAASAQTPALPQTDPCAADPSCRHASAAELFALADSQVADGDLAGAQSILEALTADPDPELRAEARFRLAAIRERRGDLAGAIGALRDLLGEKPGAQRARLELGRLLALQGNDKAARRELRRATAGGLPADVAQTVRRFSTALNALKRRGVSIDIAIAADSNINRSTNDKYVDTVIAPFELDPDARGQSGIAVSLGGEAYSRDRILGTTLLTRAGARGDFFLGKKRFNDIQLSVTSGPEIATGIGRIRPALVHERRWYGGRAYSAGYGAALNWLAAPGAKSQLQIDVSAVRQSIRRNAFLDGTRYAASATYDHGFTPETSARFALRGAILDAKARPESLHQAGADMVVAHVFAAATIFAQAGYTRTQGLAPLALFGKTRRDDRIDLAAGLIARGLAFRGFAPLVRLIYTDSRSNLALYDYRRARVEFGLTREF